MTTTRRGLSWAHAGSNSSWPKGCPARQALAGTNCSNPLPITDVKVAWRPLTCASQTAANAKQIPHAIQSLLPIPGQHTESSLLLLCQHDPSWLVACPGPQIAGPPPPHAFMCTGLESNSLTITTTVTRTHPNTAKLESCLDIQLHVPDTQASHRPE